MVQPPPAAEELAPQQPWVLRTFGTESLFAFVAVAFVAFTAIFALGLFSPTMAMYLDSNLLIERRGVMRHWLRVKLHGLEWQVKLLKRSQAFASWI